MPIDPGPLTGRDFAAVLFDMDGTLIDSTPAVIRSWARWATEYDVDAGVLEQMHGLPARSIVEVLLPAREWDAATRRIEDLEVGDLAGIVALPGASEAVRALPGQCAIATSSTRRLAAVRLPASGVTVPEVVVTVDDVDRGKPAPDPYLVAAERLGVNPADCLVVEDAPGGLAAGRAAGCATLAVTTTSTREALAGDPNVDAVVDTLADVRFELIDGRVHLTAHTG